MIVCFHVYIAKTSNLAPTSNPKRRNMETTDYVSYDLALKLKACGFDELCIAQWACEPDGKPMLLGSTAFVFSNAELKGRDVTAPLLYHAQKWLREKKKIDVLVYNCSCGYLWELSKADVQNRGTILLTFDWNGEDKDSGCWLTYEAALSAGIFNTLELIKEEI